MEKPSAYRGDEPYVFVCYAHEDAHQVYPEVAWLQSQGINVWYDEGISPGAEWTEGLAEAIEGCATFAFFVTPGSVIREHCRRELNFAQEESREVLAVHLSPTEVPAGLRLSLNNRQAIFKHELTDSQYRQALLDAVGGPSAEQRPKVEIPTSYTSPRWAIYAVAAIVLFIAGAWWMRAPVEPPLTESDEEVESVHVPASAVLHNSIAVLPFDNLSPDPDDAYFAAGIHEEVINQLVKIRDLSVIARTSVMQYAGVHKPIAEIADELNVGTLLEGSVRYAGNRVRITAQLIDGESGANIWSKAYEDSLDDIFGIQLAIATQIAQTLEAEFSPSERARIGTRSTHNSEAYAHYLRAVSGWGNYSPTGPLHDALDAAIALDPKFAAALAFKSFVHSIESTAGYSFFPDFDGESQRHFSALAREFAQRALEIDDQQARAHYAMRWAHTLDREWAASQQSAARAYQANPNDYTVLNSAGWAALARGEIDLGIEYMERSMALAPNDFASQGNFADFLSYAQRWNYAEQQAKLVTTLAPKFGGPWFRLAEARSHLGDVDGTRSAANTLEAMKPVPFQLAMLANAYNRVGDLDAAERVVEQARTFDSHQNLPFFIASGDQEGAINYMDRALEEGYPWLVGRDLHYHSEHPFFDPIRAHPKFDELVKRAALPVR